MAQNTSQWGKATAAKRYAAGGMMPPQAMAPPTLPPQAQVPSLPPQAMAPPSLPPQAQMPVLPPQAMGHPGMGRPMMKRGGKIQKKAK